MLVEQPDGSMKEEPDCECGHESVLHGKIAGRYVWCGVGKFPLEVVRMFGGDPSESCNCTHYVPKED